MAVAWTDASFGGLKWIDEIMEAEGYTAEEVFTVWDSAKDAINAFKRQGSPQVEYITEVRSVIAYHEKIHALLENGKRVREFQPANDDEKKHLANFQFLTSKKQVVVFNVGEGDLAADGRGEELKKQHPGSMVLSAKIEMEIAQLPADERDLFLKDLGLSEPVAARLARQAYAALNAISFFTVGEDEVRAWTIENGDNAVTAAGKVHTDLARGFIRAEVYDHSELVALGSEKALKAAGKMRLEGKEYVVQDGEIVHIRANTR